MPNDPQLETGQSAERKQEQIVGGGEEEEKKRAKNRCARDVVAHLHG